MIFHTFLSLEMPFLSQKLPIFDIWIYQYYGFRLRKEETGGDSLFILDRVNILSVILYKTHLLLQFIRVTCTLGNKPVQDIVLPNEVH